MSNVIELPSGRQVAVAFYDGAWKVRAYRDGRGGPIVSFPTKEKADEYAASLARIIRHNERLNGGVQ